MNETIKKQIERIKEYWGSRSKKQKIIGVSLLLSFIAALSLVVYFSTRTTMVPLYSDLTPAEVGAVKENLDGRGIPYEITNGGTGLMVPEEHVDTLKVDLAAEGLPQSGNIDYGFFGDTAGFGMTDNEFNVLKLEAMQTELAELMKGIEGVKDASVMITLPQEQVFVSDTAETASASVVLNTEIGYQFDEKQVKALHHLVSKSVPNLPVENIVIMNQNFEYFEMAGSASSSGDAFEQQMAVKKQIERDIQSRVQSMLGTLMGPDKVVATVTADIDFTQENREENLVTPVDEENMEGIQISAQRITETYTGDAAGAGGIPQAEQEGDTATYLEGATGTGEYERNEETINNEVNRIRREITESPYKIRDLGIQVMVEPPTPDDPNTMPDQSVEDIQRLLGNIVRTSIDESYNTELTDQALEEKITVSVQPLNGRVTFDQEPEAVIPWWVYVIGGILLVAIGVLIFFMIRRRREAEAAALEAEEAARLRELEVEELTVEESDATVRRKQLEKMAQEKPEEFAKLLRSWLAEE